MTTKNTQDAVSERVEEFKNLYVEIEEVMERSVLDRYEKWLTTTLHQELQKAVADYQTNYEQKHIASAVEVAKREILEHVCKVLEEDAVDVELHYDMYGFERATAIAEGLRRAKTTIKNLLDVNK